MFLARPVLRRILEGDMFVVSREQVWFDDSRTLRGMISIVEVT